MTKYTELYEQMTHQSQRDLLNMGVLSFNLGKPALEDDDNCVATTDMANGTYTIAAQPDVARNLRVTITQQGGQNDTMGKLNIVGKDILGNVIEEEITPTVNTTTDGDKAFAEITSITQSGWVVSSASNFDQIKIGYHEKIGLPVALSSIDNVLLCLFHRAVDAATAAVGDPATVEETTLTVAGTYNGARVMQVLVRPEE